MAKYILGIDEAGRGPVIGPLVVAGVLIREDDQQELKDLGAKDSKLLSPRRREELRTEIKKIAKNVRVKIIPATTIDKKMQTISLNDIELEAMASIIKSIPEADRIIIDLPTKKKTFVDDIRKKSKTRAEIIAEFKADRNHIPVSAASIIAKTTRDAEIARIKKTHNIDCGTGYPSDPRTKEHMESIIKSPDTIPEYVRRSWETTKALLEQKTQKNIFQFSK